MSYSGGPPLIRRDDLWGASGMPPFVTLEVNSVSSGTGNFDLAFDTVYGPSPDFSVLGGIPGSLGLTLASSDTQVTALTDGLWLFWAQLSADTGTGDVNFQQPTFLGNPKYINPTDINTTLGKTYFEFAVPMRAGEWVGIKQHNTSAGRCIQYVAMNVTRLR